MKKRGGFVFWGFFTVPFYFTHMIGKSLFRLCLAYLVQGNLAYHYFMQVLSYPIA